MIYRTQEVLTADDRYAKYRIPGMLVTRAGTLLMYHEARREASDWARMDIVLHRSTDHGVHFDAGVLLARGTDAFPTVNNPVMVQDRNGRIHFLYCEDYGIGGGRVWRRYSDDDGCTFSPAIDITASTMPVYRNCFALGPGHGIVTRDGTLVVPIWMVPRACGAPHREHAPSVVSTLCSTDDGESWRVGEILGSSEQMVNPSESSAALLSDGRIYLNIRLGGGVTCRGQAVSPNGYADWQDIRPVPELIDPGCFGSVVAYDDGVHPRALILANCENREERLRVTVKVSLDDGESWTHRRVLDAERGGYVEVAADDRNGLIYVLYEGNWGETNTLAVFDWAWLMGDSTLG